MAAISGIGAFYPDEIRYNSAWSEAFANSGAERGDRTFNDIPLGIDDAARVTEKYLRAERTDPFLGVRERRVAGPSISAMDAETAAAKQALEDARIAASDVDAVLSYSMVPDNLMPGAAGAVAHRLGIKSAMCVEMNAACATLTPQIAMAMALIDSGQAKNVLITQSHLLLRTFPLQHPAAPGLGDGATAVLVSAKGRWPILAWHAVTDGSYHHAVTWIREEEQGGTSSAPWWASGGAFRLGSGDRAQAKQLMRDTVSVGAQTVRELMAKAGMDLERVDLLASVQPRGWIPCAISEVLGLRDARLPSVFETRGHLGACGPLSNLHQAYETGMTEGASLAVLYAQGAGFTRSALLLGMDVSP